MTSNKMVYVVYKEYTNEDTVCAVTFDREVACKIADELEIKDGGEYWVDDIPVSHTLEQYKEQNNA